MYKIRTRRELIFDDKSFSEGSDICFHYKDMKIIGKIERIVEESGNSQPFIVAAELELYENGNKVPVIPDKSECRVYYLSRMTDVCYISYD